MTVYTIGVYDWDRQTFFAALGRAHVDVLVDVRRRRAVRGPHYAFANARRLIAELQRNGIAYVHALELAPPKELLALQHAIDAEGPGMRARTKLAPAYVKGYRSEVLARADFAALARELEPYRAPALMCVERLPQACHRSLAAPRLARAVHATAVHDLLP